MHQVRKGQVKGTTRGDIQSQVRFVSTAFGLAAQAPSHSPIHTTLIEPCQVIATLPIFLRVATLTTSSVTQNPSQYSVPPQDEGVGNLHVILPSHQVEPLGIHSQHIGVTLHSIKE